MALPQETFSGLMEFLGDDTHSRNVRFLILLTQHNRRMKNHNAFMITALVGLLWWASCSPVYYIPNTQNVPMLHSAGELNLTVAGNASQGELQGAFAPMEHLGILLNAAAYLPKDADNGNGGSGILGELGLGYYGPIGTHFIFESYGLIGAGRVENHLPSTLVDFPNTSGAMRATALRFGVQPSIALRTKYFQAGISSRIISLNYTGLQGNLNYLGEDQFAYLRANRAAMLLEPAITLRGGLEYLKLQLQYQLSFNFSNADFHQQKSLLSLGLNLDIE